MDIATLGIAVDSRPAAAAAQDLDRLTAAGERAEQSARGTGSAFDQAGKKVAASSNSISQAAAKNGAAFAQTDQRIKAATNSLKQNQQALRTLPMQMTDIAVGLSTGQSPFVVMMQQGGQLKDVFGGIGPAVRAVGGYVAALVNPFTIAAAAVGALALAYKQGSDEQTAFGRALAMTGNMAGLTTEQLADMATAIGRQSGTTRDAAAALTLFVATGADFGDQLDELASSAIAWQKATGVAVEDTVADFAKLAKDPAEAVAKLNEKYHFLTLSVYEQIKALQARGQVQEAAEIAERALATALDQRAGKIKEDLGYIERLWKNVAASAAGAWDAMANVGRENTLERQIESLKERIVALDGLDGNRGQSNALRKRLADLEFRQFSDSLVENALAQQKADEQERQDAAIAAEGKIASIRDSILTNAERREKAILEIRQSYEKIRAASPESPLLRDGSEERLVQGTRERFKDKDPGVTLGNIGSRNDALFEDMSRKAFETSDVMREVARSNEAYFDGISKSLEKVRDGSDEVLEFLMTDEERLRASYERRQAMLDRAHETGIMSEKVYLEATQKLREKLDEDALATSDSYWDRYLAAAEKNLLSFDELAGDTIENFSRGFGDAFEKVIFDAETAGDAFKGFMEGVARSTVNALGQMAAQWLAYQAVQILTGKAAAQAAAAPAIAEAEAKSASAQIGAFNAVVGTPYVGPVLAPVAAAAAAAFTSPLVSRVASSFAGMAHEGMSNIPREGTWLLDGGERVIAPQQNRDLTAFLSNQSGGGGGGDTFHISISAVDARSVDRLIQRSGDSVARSLASSARNFHRPRK